MDQLPGELHVNVDTDGSPKEDVGLQADIYPRLHVCKQLQ
jgi:hypothetical protein